MSARAPQASAALVAKAGRISNLLLVATVGLLVWSAQSRRRGLSTPPDERGEGANDPEEDPSQRGNVDPDLIGGTGKTAENENLNDTHHEGDVRGDDTEATDEGVS